MCPGGRPLCKILPKAYGAPEPCVVLCCTLSVLIRCCHPFPLPKSSSSLLRNLLQAVAPKGSYISGFSFIHRLHLVTRMHQLYDAGTSRAPSSSELTIWREDIEDTPDPIRSEAYLMLHAAGEWEEIKVHRFMRLPSASGLASGHTTNLWS